MHTVLVTTVCTYLLFILFLSHSAEQSACFNNGGCSQLCVLNPSGRTCMCEIGMKIGEDGTSCKSFMRSKFKTKPDHSLPHKRQAIVRRL